VWCRERLAKFCVGNGADLGFGGAPITPNAICIDRPEGHPERAVVPPPVPPTHLVGDVRDLYWFKDGVLDFLFSSHCLEDFESTTEVLREWLRVIKPGGHLVLFLPDQQKYVEHCKANGEPANSAHKIPDFSLEYVKKHLPGGCEVVHELFPVPGNAYSFDLVVKKLYTPVNAVEHHPDKMYD
jgi:SAM-dependent methyltransferase